MGLEVMNVTMEPGVTAQCVHIHTPGSLHCCELANHDHNSCEIISLCLLEPSFGSVSREVS